MEETQYGLPLIVSDFTETPAQAARGLKRIRFEKGSDKLFDEHWLQKLVSLYPNILPIQQIEPALTPVVSICMELPLAAGFADNLFATPDGDLIIAETKLFTNPGARREVVAQVIDYAKDLSALSYESLEEAVFKADAPDGRGGKPKVGLYEAVASSGGREELDQKRFIDSVSRNLERGRFLVLVIGDGITLGTENLAAFLQQHAGMHFTFGLVDLAIFALPSEMGSYLVQPRVLVRTTNIERGIVSIEDHRTTVKPPLCPIDPKGTTISEEKFYEELAASLPSVVPRLKAFTARLEAIGVAIEFGKDSMKLRWHPAEQGTWNFAVILTGGKVWTEQLNLAANAIGHIDLSHAYLQRLASSVPGADVRKLPNPVSWFVRKGGTYITIDELLAHEEDWFSAIQEFMTAVTDLLKDQ